MNNSQLKYGVYLSYISLFVTNIANLIITPFLIKNLGQSEYGLYMLIGALVGYLIVLDFGLSNTTIRFVAKYRAENNKEKEENFLFLTFFIYFFITIFILIIGTLMYLNLDTIFGSSLTAAEVSLAKTMFMILVINLAFTLPLNSFTGIVNAYENFVFPRFLTILRTLVRTGLVIVLLTNGFSVISVVMIDAILNLAMMIITMLYVFKKLKVKIKLHVFDLKTMKEILSYSSLIFLGVIVDQFYWRIGHLILGIMASTTQVAIFAIGMMFGQYFITFATAISGVFLPKITRMIVKNANGEELTNLMIKTGRIQFVILTLILSGFILYGKEFIDLWAGPNFDDAWLVALIVMIPLSVVLTQTIGISILQAKNLHGYRALILLAISVINVFISLVTIEKYGIFGAAAATSLSLILGNIIIMNLYYFYKVRLNIIRFYKELFKGLLVSFFITLIVGSILNLESNGSWLLLSLNILVHTILFLSINWIIGMNSNEKELFSREFRKIKKIIKL